MRICKQNKREFVMNKYHSALWDTVNHIAQMRNTSCSGLAVQCGLDSTSFNQSKRKTKCGQLRWLSMMSVAKILMATEMTPVQFAEIYQKYLNKEK